MEHSYLIVIIRRRGLTALAVLALVAAGMIMAGAGGAAGRSQNVATLSSQDPHAGHAPRQSPTPTPTPTPAPSPGPHDHHQHQPQPTPTQSPRLTPTPAVDHSGHATPAQAMPAQEPMRDEEATGPVMTLQELETLAAQNNPTLAQAEAAVRAAEGRRRQAGLFPNPVVGYEGESLAFRGAGEVSEHSFFVEQTVPLGGKLGKARSVFERERDQAQVVAEA